MVFGELDFLAMLHERLAGAHDPPGVLVGVGDDAAVLACGGRELVATTDLLIDGIDFRLTECGYRLAGRKAMAKNLSDIAAMGVAPWTAFVSVGLPGGFSAEDAAQLLDGLVDTACAFGCAIAGGDTKRSPGPLIVNVALLGRSTGRPPVLRSGARPGDLLCVTGRLGGSLFGRHLTFEPRVAAGLRLNEACGVRAMIDLSDGLSSDLGRLCAASGVGAEIEAERVPVSADAERAAQDGGSALAHALNDGEDYELLCALPPENGAALAADPLLGPLVTCIGRCLMPDSGVLLRAGGATRPLEPRGFEHRFDARPGGGP
ncbi:MAG: thiamine-monophosphate kinase [Planctomycetes bacterium]|nr:thiamine-monophosphate kinase [Planctomycetota bacterium]